MFETFCGPDMYVAIPAVQDMVSDVDIDGATVNECASVNLLGSGSCGTWSSSCLAAGCIPRRPPTSRNLCITPFRTLSRSRTFCVASRHERHTCNSRNFRNVVCKTQHTRHSFVASSSSALLSTDTCRSTVGPGTREDYGRLISARRSPLRKPPRVR